MKRITTHALPLFAALSILVAFVTANAGTVYVDASATGANDGTTWSDAFVDLQDALGAAAQGDAIWVVAGTYKPTSGTDREASFTLASGVELYGGFAGGETDLSQRDWEANETILSGDIGTEGDESDNCHHVIFADGTDATAVLDGFTVTGGHGTGDDPAPYYGRGGGLCLWYAGATLKNLIVANNASVNEGGGMFTAGGELVTLTHVAFMFNDSAQGGGLCAYASVSLSDVTFLENHSSNHGGGIYQQQGIGTFIDITFRSNTARWHGGGYYGVSSSVPSFTNAIFVNNVSNGNGIYQGGGGACVGGDNFSFCNTIFTGNTAVGSGGGLIIDDGDGTLVNVTFSENHAGSEGGGIYKYHGNVELQNTVAWGNSATEADDQIAWLAGEPPPTISYSLIQGCGGSGPGWDASVGVDGGNNLDADPLFVDGSGGNVRLQAGSPAIDAGDDAALPPGVIFDLDGGVRIVGAAVDMGAYEFPGCPAGPILFVDPSAAGANDGTSWTDALVDLKLALGLAACSSVNEIWVAAGTYYVTAGTDREASFQLTSGVGVYGGFAGTETDLSQRDWQANETILSGDIGVRGDDADNSYHVVTGFDLDATAVLDGFTITKGNASDVNYHQNGAGMYNQNGSPTLENLRFLENCATNWGAGLYNQGGSPTLTNVMFVNNRFADSYAMQHLGGGMFNDNGSPTLTNVLFWGNTADHGGINVGGGLCSMNGNLTVTNGVFAQNYATTAGGGLSLNSTSSVLINTIVWGNEPSSMMVNGAQVTISSSLIQGCGGSGAGWHVYYGIDGGGNLDVDPQFVDEAGGNLRLQEGSPAIDAGDSEAPNLPETDLDGNPRIVGVTVDMGPYEWDSSIHPAVFLQQLTAVRSGSTVIVSCEVGESLSGRILEVWRALPGQPRRCIGQMVQTGSRSLTFTDPAPPPGDADYWLRLVIADGTGTWLGSARLGAQTIPDRLTLSPCAPNPFNPSTTIRYALPQPAHVKLAVYDQRGRLVRVLVEGPVPAGEQAMEWNGQDAQGRAVSSGVYFTRLETKQGVRTGKMVLAR